MAASAATTTSYAQAGSSDTQMAAVAPQSAADACLQALDRPVVDGLRLVSRCTAYINTGNSSPGEMGAAHLVRAAAYQNIGEPAKARDDYKAAVDLYTSVIDTSEPYPEFVFRRATAYHALGDIHNALLDYDLAIRTNPWNVVAFADRGLLLAHYKSQYSLAVADFDQALKLSPNNVDILILRGDAYAAQDKFAQAMPDLDLAVSLAPRNPQAYTHRASAYSRQNLTDSALKDYAQALALDPANFDALISRGAIYSEGGNAKAAIADMDKALAIRPGNPVALYDRGYAHFVGGEYDAAIADYSAAIAAAPGFGMAYANRCLTSALAGKEKAAALADCDKAAELLPDRADILETRGLVDLKYGDNKTALATYDAALKVEGDRALALYGRGIARARLGDGAAGTADKQAARTLYPNIDREFAPYGVE